MKDTITACIEQVRKDVRNNRTETSSLMEYCRPGIAATLKHRSLFGKPISVPLEIPETGSIVLARTQPDSELGRVEPVPEQLQLILGEVLGKPWSKYVAALQYCNERVKCYDHCSEIAGHLDEIKLMWIDRLNDDVNLGGGLIQISDYHDD